MTGANTALIDLLKADWHNWNASADKDTLYGWTVKYANGKVETIQARALWDAHKVIKSRLKSWAYPVQSISIAN
jgi:hypothetical protein